MLFRGVRTMQERRAWDREYGRWSRLPSVLPDNYDDIRRADTYDRSWKRHRRTQYKPITYEGSTMICVTCLGNGIDEDNGECCQACDAEGHFCDRCKTPTWRDGLCSECLDAEIDEEIDEEIAAE